MRSYLPVAGAMKMVQKKEYESIACGGFSGGCDMLLRAIAFKIGRASCRERV